MTKNQLQETFGNIDIYLFDQLLKRRFDGCKTILDAGCGYGRNLVYFLKNGFGVFGVDINAEAIAEVKKLSKEFNPTNSPDNFRVAQIEDMPFDDDFFDLVICSAVLHFATDKSHFDKMLRSIWRVIKPGGFLFARLASNIGLEKLVIDLGNGRYEVPDGSERFLVNEQFLLDYTRSLNAQLFEPIKTTNVQSVRCMTTWCVKKNH